MSLSDQSKFLNKWMIGYLKKKDGRSCNHTDVKWKQTTKWTEHGRCQSCKRILKRRIEKDGN